MQYQFPECKPSAIVAIFPSIKKLDYLIYSLGLEFFQYKFITSYDDLDSH